MHFHNVYYHVGLRCLGLTSKYSEIAFKQALFIDETKRHKYNKTYKFEAGRVIAHHRRQYWNYVDKIGETLADIMFHGIAHLQYSPPCEEQI